MFAPRFLAGSAGPLFALLLAACGGAGGSGGGGGGLDEDASLAGLETSAGGLSPAFAAVTTRYAVYVGYYAVDFRVVPTAGAPGQKILVNGVPTESGEASAPARLGFGQNTVLVEVTAADGTTTRLYTLTVSRNALAEPEAYVKASNTGTEDGFGLSVALSGDTLVVGAGGEASAATGVNGNQADDSALRAGAVYVFVRSGGVWTQQAYLKASNTDAGDEFGRSVAVSGDTLVVGAWMEGSGAVGVNGDGSDDSAPTSGAAYVFVRNGTTWAQQAYLKASNTDAGDQFGTSVAIHGDTVVIGAPFERSGARVVDGDSSDDFAQAAGAAYVFVRSGATWTQQAYLKASNADAGDRFGNSVAVHGGTIVVGAPGEGSAAAGVNGVQDNETAPLAGAGYVFVRTGATWAQDAYLKASNPTAGDVFGAVVAISQDTVVVGAPGEDGGSAGVNGPSNETTFEAGAAYVFVRNAGAWTQQAYLKAPNPGLEDVFGASVAVSDGTLVVGAYGEDSAATMNGNAFDESAPQAGAAYVFLRVGGTWISSDYLKATNPGSADFFGWSVAVSGDVVAGGAWGEDGASTGVNRDPTSEAARAAGAVYVVR